MNTKKKVLYIIVCAAPPAANVHELVVLAQKGLWEVCIIATPHAQPFINVQQLEELSGFPVRVNYRIPCEAKQTPECDAIIVVPATFNTINKLANGIADNLATTTLCNALGAKTPLVIVPYMKESFANHPVYKQNVKTIQKWGIQILQESLKLSGQNENAWNAILQRVNQISTIKPSPKQKSLKDVRGKI